ncbi:hypothetical protein KQY30_24840 [Streptomyces sp. GMY02]|uniref:hypothetical protein n=1 Tax=Streptomyces sp. GMY02 TaxID=1333528 RepID=UPI001C2C2126|nr:hypothetical protein [Streptomyces sp. GMY02]QXE36955.1 hypothetical protein KQY30_24840 [Streptomyces sp. GMY02]
MDTKPWRERVRGEDALLEQLAALTSESAARRAAALAEGVAELGSVYAVANDIGKSWTAVDKSIKKHGKKKGPAGTGPDTTA